MRFGLSAGRF